MQSQTSTTLGTTLLQQQYSSETQKISAYRVGEKGKEPGNRVAETFPRSCELYCRSGSYLTAAKKLLTPVLQMLTVSHTSHRVWSLLPLGFFTFPIPFQFRSTPPPPPAWLHLEMIFFFPFRRPCGSHTYLDLQLPNPQLPYLSSNPPLL